MSSRILLIEDEPGLVLTLSDLMAVEGYEVESAMDGPGGLARASRERFDLLVHPRTIERGLARSQKKR